MASDTVVAGNSVGTRKKMKCKTKRQMNVEER